MNTKKYMSITDASQAIAIRDLQDLAERNILIPTGDRRSTPYTINLSQDSQQPGKRLVAPHDSDEFHPLRRESDV